MKSRGKTRSKKMVTIRHNAGVAIAAAIALIVITILLIGICIFDTINGFIKWISGKEKEETEMNLWIGVGRLGAEPKITTTQTGLTIARYSLAIDRPGKDRATDWIPCVCFGKTADFAAQYLHKGTKILVEGRIQTGKYDKDGHTVYTTEAIVSRHEFVERKGDTPAAAPVAEPTAEDGGFMNIPDGFDEELPFS